MSIIVKFLNKEIATLKERVAAAVMPDEMRSKVSKDIIALERSVGWGATTKVRKVSLEIYRLGAPNSLGKESEDQLDVEKTKEIFESHHFGMMDVKDRFVEYVSSAQVAPTTVCR